MATLKVRVLPGEIVKLWPAAKVEHLLRYGASPPLNSEIAGATADATGLATFSQPSRIEFLAQRASNGAYIKLMDSTTRGGS